MIKITLTALLASAVLLLGIAVGSIFGAVTLCASVVFLANIIN